MELIIVGILPLVSDKLSLTALLIQVGRGEIDRNLVVLKEVISLFWKYGGKPRAGVPSAYNPEGPNLS